MKDLSAYLPDGKQFAFWEAETIYDVELHVDCRSSLSSDENDGSRERPLKTIQEAANRAKAGTRVWIHGGEYRECVHPVCSGEGPQHMVCFEAFGDGEVIVKASEAATDFKVSTGWRKCFNPASKENVDEIEIWEHRLNPEKFKGYNPFCAVNILHDRLFIEYDKTDMTPYLNRRGMVFCDGKPLKQVTLYNQLSEQEGSFWVEANGQTIHFRLEGDEAPDGHLIEVACREQCFAPEIPFLSYIKVKGITCAHAAMGAPVPQRGAISCFRGHHWIIENCVVDWSNAVGIDVGNECWHHDWIEGQIIGHSIVRGCRIIDAGVCGIAGLFAKHMLIEDNLIEGTGWQKMELSWEAGGIKLHDSVDSLIRRNIFKNTLRADHLWLDCGNENNRITQNLFLNGIEQREAIFMECSRDGVNLIDNNIIWNVEGRFDKNKIPDEPGSSGWYKTVENDVVNGYAIYGEGTDYLYIANNLIGNCRSAGYFAKPVAFRMDRMQRGGTSRNAKIRNNIFYACGEAALKLPTEKNQVDGNAYVKQSGGYLRVIYPEPEACLDLPAWKEFYGFDLQGQEAWFDIKVDTEKYTLQFVKSPEKPFAFPGALERHGYIYQPEELKRVDRADSVISDFYGQTVDENGIIPGPIQRIEENFVYAIDPRKR